MKTILFALIAFSSLTAFAADLECHLRKGKYGIDFAVAGQLVLDGSTATFTSETEVMKFAFTEKESTRTGTWLNFESINTRNEVASLSVEESGVGRKTYITIESAKGKLIDSLSMRCIE